MFCGHLQLFKNQTFPVREKTRSVVKDVADVEPWLSLPRQSNIVSKQDRITNLMNRLLPESITPLKKTSDLQNHKPPKRIALDPHERIALEGDHHDAKSQTTKPQ